MANPRPHDGIPTDLTRSARGIDAAARPAEVTCQSRDGEMARRWLRTEWSEGQTPDKEGDLDGYRTEFIVPDKDTKSRSSRSQSAHSSEEAG